MEWLNKVDETLDWVLETAAAARAARPQPDSDAAAVAVGSDDDGRAAAAAAVVDNSVNELSAKSSFEPAAAVRHEINTDHGIVEGGRQNNENVTANNSDPSKAKAKPRPPPPPPPPINNSTPPPTTTERAMPSSLLPLDACPSTPLMAMAGEFLVLDESPHPSKNINHGTVNDDRMDNLNEKCDDGNICKPPDSIFMEVDDAETSTSIGEEADATIQQEAETAIQQHIKLPLVSLQTKEHSEELVMAHEDEKVAPTHRFTAATTYGDASVGQQTMPSMSQMQDFARASPAPTKVIIGDRDETIRAIPPPPPPYFQAANNEQQQTTNSQAQSQSKTQEPPSPSNFIIHLPGKLPPPPPSPMAPNNYNTNWTTATPTAPTTPNPIRPRPRAAGRATPRPTPGVIRRRLREPSLSPPESPASSFNMDSIEAKENAGPTTTSSIPPPPPFIPSNYSLDNEKDDGVVFPTEIMSTALDASIDKERVGSASFPPPPSGAFRDHVKITKPSAERDGNVLPNNNDAQTAAQYDDEWDDNIPKAAKGGVKYKTQPIVSKFPPPPFHNQMTPITHNRKTTSEQHPVTILPPLNKVVDRALDMALGPVTQTVTDHENNSDFDKVESDLIKLKEKEDGGEAPTTLPPVNQVDKALDWVLGPVKVRDHGNNAEQAESVRSKADAGGDANRVGQENVEAPMTDAITGWFKRMGSTQQGGKIQRRDVKNNNADDFFSEDSIHSQESNDDSELTDSNELDDFALPSPTFSQVQDDDDQSWDPSLNCYGFFHVRLLRAQRLPCASGFSVNATLSLAPWKGRIRIPAHITVNGPEGAGVCLRWDKPSDQKQRGGDHGSKSGSKDGESPEDPFSHSMVHAYNNEDTPVPTIVLEISISSLGASLGGVFDRFLCSVSIPCHDILRNPRSWNHKWFHASRVQGEGRITDEANSDNMETAPLILLETCFEPKVTRATVSTLSNQMIADQETTDIDDTELNISGDSDTLGSIPHIIRPTDRRGLLFDDESISKSSTLTPALVSRNPTIAKSHLLRVRSFWTPTWCAVCSKAITTGWTMQGKNFECEACHIFCCRDCQLQVDARIPCGSELATIAVKNAQQYQVPSFSQVMTTLAPNVMEKATSGGVEVKDSIQKLDERSNLNGRSIDGIGILNIRVLRACLFGKTFPSESDPNEIFESESNLHNGDHYVRVSWLGSKESKRTKTVLQTPKPLFDSEEMVFDVPHYGMEYKLEVIDGSTEKPIGSCLLSAQGLLQWQRDDMLAKKDRLLLSFFHLKTYSEPRKVKLQLRTGVKDGFGLNFYNSSKVAGGPSKGKETSQHPGETSGWLELDVHLEEDRQLFYSPQPRRCPTRPEEEFDIALIQLHIARITAIVEGIQKLVSTYMYVVGWESPKLTGASMIIFVVLTLRFNLEYLGSLPIGCLVLYMIYLAYLRVNGHFKDRWTLKEKESIVKSETKIEKNQSIFRPFGLLQVGNLQGKNLRSRELGLPGSFYASIMYDPLRYADEKMKSSLINIDSSSGCIHEVGATVSSGITSNPIWSHVQESPELMRLKHLLPDNRLWRQEKELDASLAYPILQPITDVSFSDETGDDKQCTGVSLMPWEQSSGAVVIQVRFSDVLGTFQVFDNVLGEVVIPLSKLAGSGKVVEGFFRLLEVGTKDTVPGESSDAPTVKSEASGEDTDSEDDVIPAANFPELYLRVKFSSNTTLIGDTSLSDDMESFKVISEEISRTASIAQENSIGVLGSSLNTINTVRTLGGKLQNQISVVVDMLERVRNAFNFSNPRITVFILICLMILWIVLAWIPTRLVILFAGLGQFGATFYTQFMALPAKKTTHKEKAKEGLDSGNIGNPFVNLFFSIPTDEDLRRTYFWEARRLGEKEREKFAVAKRQTRLEKLWKAKWHGTLELKEQKAEQPTSSTSSRNWSWETAFALIEGHRFIYWKSEKHFDTGEAPMGQIFFAGHSGLAGLSPLDLRELSKEEIPFVVSIFGRGSKMQQKITVLAPTSDAKDSLENAVIDASMDAKAD
mmetsp:Transcript_21844/g.47472  ORF Transcript_21844/g.47472 Transcript_21844/m.47472 type:complete len:2018 (+) Transcript_21844:77-6130(+)|eukprot:CAMPEP_0172303654 /NCGR_PEP_ID=MMETSP1058-20130122/5166_1 /TAXON_ID=83371 /ORGANISM="Detonula confervacea, Strain CCMP 353" /LENGTH=2017 /DNA_ID=CAMNT_0013014557 /DNA_START=17 /DNA_END=6070 /DNA_ORIENTATION=-